MFVFNKKPFKEWLSGEFVFQYNDEINMFHKTNNEIFNEDNCSIDKDKPCFNKKKTRGKYKFYLIEYLEKN